jgi:hypothetical protein
MAESKRRSDKIAKDDAEEVKEILSVVSTEVPTLIKNIIATVFSEEAGRNMGKAAAAFYKELKESGIPNDMALRMTEDYMQNFTGFGDLLKHSIEKKSQKRLRVRPDSEEEED